MTLANGDFTPVRLSSEDFPAKDRIEAMREIYSRAILKLDIEPLPDSPLHVDMTLHAMPGLAIAAGTCSPICARHTSELIDSDDLILSLALTGSSTVQHCGREAVLEKGEAILTTSAETGRHVYHSDSRFMTFRLPLNLLSPLIADLSTALMRPVPRNTQALQLLANYVGSLQGMAELAMPELRHLVTTHVHDLAALALGASRDAAEAARGRGVRAARLSAIKADIIANIGQRSLSVEGTTARHRVSARYLRKLFEAEGTSFSDFVLEQRLARAYRSLTDPRSLDRTISAIAFDVGFGDLSYFNRTFRRYYDATPSDVRAAARRDGNG